MLRLNFTPAQADLILHILCMFEGTFLLEAANLIRPYYYCFNYFPCCFLSSCISTNFYSHQSLDERNASYHTKPKCVRDWCNKLTT